MARHHRNRSSKKIIIEKSSPRADSTPKEPRLHPDTQKSIWAVVFLGLSAIFALAGFDQAGPAGSALHRGLGALLGIGYAILPLTLLFIAAVFFASRTRKVMGITLV